jgi:hypothetical protein
MTHWTAAPMTAQGPPKGEPSSASMWYGLRPQPARLVRGSSRRIMTMRFRPANIRVIHRRVCSWAVMGPAVQNQTRSKLTSGNVFPLRRPSRVSGVPERYSPSRVRCTAPNSDAPLTAARRSGRMAIATGGSGGNTSRAAQTQNKRPAFLLRRQAGLKTKPLKLRGLDRVAPYQK